MPILFFAGSSLTNSLYKAFPSGETILADIIARPALALTMLAGIVAGVIAFILGFIDIFRKKENALLVYVSTLIGLLLIIFLVGEVIPPYH